MEKKTIGAFIAALRKANGMTQQELADKLNVSNKAVSRWEREECAPDISLIPVIAEIFGITCDELLRGERIKEPAVPSRSDVKVEKQIKSLVNRTIQSFKTLIYISLALAVSGFVFMLGITYGFYRAVIGFAVMLLFEVAAVLLAFIAMNKMKQTKADNELLENADSELIDKYDSTLGNYTFASFFASFAAIVISLPQICLDSDYLNSVWTIDSYFPMVLLLILLVLTPLCLLLKKPCVALISGRGYSIKLSIDRKILKMDLYQLGSSVLSAVLFVLAPYAIDDFYEETSLLYSLMISTAIACLVVNLVFFIICTVRYRKEDKKYFRISLRNLLTIPCALILANWHSVGFRYNPYTDEGTRFEVWDPSAFWGAVTICAAVFAVFAIINNIKMLKNK